MTKTPTVKIGFVGSGHIARVHAQALQALGGTEILAWSAQRRERAVAAAQDFGGEATTTEALLSNTGIDIAIITTPTPYHAELAITAMSRTANRSFAKNPWRAPGGRQMT
jgi:predicted dehydrogenase